MTTDTPLAAPSVEAIYPLDVLECHEFLSLRPVGIHGGITVYRILGAKESPQHKYSRKTVALIEVAQATEQVRVQLIGVQGVFTANGGLNDMDSTMKIFFPDNHGAFGSINKTRLMDYTIPRTQQMLGWKLAKVYLLPSKMKIEMTLQNIGANPIAFDQDIATIFNCKNFWLRFFGVHLSCTKKFLAVMAMLKLYYGLYHLHLETCISLPVGLLNRMHPIMPPPPTIDILGPLAEVVIRPACRDNENNKWYDIMDAKTQEIVLVVEASMLKYEIRFLDTCGVMQYWCSLANRGESDVFTHDGTQIGKVRHNAEGHQYFQMDIPTPVMADMRNNEGDHSFIFRVMSTDFKGVQLAELRRGPGRAFYRGTILPNLSSMHKALILVAFVRKMVLVIGGKPVIIPHLQRYPFRQIQC